MPDHNRFTLEYSISTTAMDPPDPLYENEILPGQMPAHTLYLVEVRTSHGVAWTATGPEDLLEGMWKSAHRWWTANSMHQLTERSPDSV